MPTLKANGINLFYESHGQGEPLVLIAGFSADHTAWREVVDRFKQDFKVIVFDNRGVGQSDTPRGPYNIELMCKDALALCDELGISQAHFVGSSMGGFIVQHLAGKFPDRVKTLTITNSAKTPDYAFNLYLQTQLDLLKAGAPLDLIIKTSCTWVYSYDYLVGKDKFNEVVQLGMEAPYPFTVEAYEAQYHALKTFNSTPWISSINRPALVIGAEEDIIFPESSIKALANSIPSAQYVGFKNAAICPWWNTQNNLLTL